MSDPQVDDTAKALEALGRLYEAAGLTQAPINTVVQKFGTDLIHHDCLHSGLETITRPEENVLLERYPDVTSSTGIPVLKIARGFDQFPFGLTAYRQTTVGECLINALTDVRHDPRFVGHDKVLNHILEVFDETVVTRMRTYLREKAVKPYRQIYMKCQARVHSHKNIDGNYLMYCQDVRLYERSVTKPAQVGFRLQSPSLKLLVLDPVVQGQKLMTVSKQQPRKERRVLLRRGLSHKEMMNVMLLNSQEAYTVVQVKQEKGGDEELMCEGGKIKAVVSPLGKIITPILPILAPTTVKVELPDGEGDPPVGAEVPDKLNSETLKGISAINPGDASGVYVSTRQINSALELTPYDLTPVTNVTPSFERELFQGHTWRHQRHTPSQLPVSDERQLKCHTEVLMESLSVPQVGSRRRQDFQGTGAQLALSLTEVDEASPTMRLNTSGPNEAADRVPPSLPVPQEPPAKVYNTRNKRAFICSIGELASEVGDALSNQQPRSKRMRMEGDGSRHLNGSDIDTSTPPLGHDDDGLEDWVRAFAQEPNIEDFF
eukprot:Blabericola_migrator_1__2884@NODE_182_length_11861_cov_167_496185_g158_i0_p4_GENE_NODE_182_length_11861_cov_167_496185_g158_i0NODE_182_length_11861_cov_167_496185_g158_i0_p4_ORF_typecomplete_len546_score72_34TFIIA_gamma_N/PF02268_16/0_2_NODE_182_length_11861_cov_167_496185_g158_i0836510002